MLKLDNEKYKSFLSFMENIDVSDMDQIYEALDMYNDTYTFIGQNNKVTNTDALAESIISRSLKDIAVETFDYRSEDFEDKVIKLTESLQGVPRMVVTEPLFKLVESVSEIIPDNKILTISQNCNRMCNYPLDFVLCKMYSNGLISDRDMGSYKSFTESTMMNLVTNLNLCNDNRVDVNEDIPTAREFIHEMIHPNFSRIEALYESYLNCKNHNGFTSDNYTCTPSSIIDKVYLCNVNGSEYIGLESESPTQYTLTRQSMNVMNNHYCRLEDLILNSIDEKSRLLSFVKETVSNLTQAPSVTSSVLAKLSVCCLMDMMYLYGNDGDGITERTLSNLMSQVDKYSISVDDLNRNEASCTLNFLKLCDMVNEGCELSDTEISLEYGKEHFHDSMLNSYTTTTESTATSGRVSGTLESYMESMQSLAEMFSIAPDGTIKVTIKEKTTYMNEYAVNHRLLKYNEKQKDYEGMKYNLIYHMILIENIEKDVIYNKKVKKDSELYKDAEQARRHAKSDIATYLPIVKQHDRSFNINDFYREVKAEQATITIQGAEAASGVKTIIKAIMY